MAMRASVATAWPAHVEKFEGRLSWMYLDTKYKVTTGTGNLIDSITAAQSLPWFKPDGRLASLAEVAAEWRAVKTRTDLAPRSGWAFQDVTTLRLRPAEVDRLLTDTTERFWADLVSRWPVINTAPADCQLAALDLAWQNGTAFLHIMSGGKYVWPNMRAAWLAQDWAAAAAAVPGTGSRADMRKRLLRNAAEVVRLRLHPDRLWDIETPKGTIMYSEKYGTEYVSWRGGNFTPTDRDVLLAIPSTVRVTQGGLSFAPASAMTHAGLGAFDLNTDGMTKAQVWEISRELLRSGIVPFPRGFNWDSFQGRTLSNTNDGNEHLHCVSNNSHSSLHDEAQAQIREWKAGGDGLRGSAKYTGPSSITRLSSWRGSPYNPRNVAAVAGAGVYFVNVDALIGLSIDRVEKHQRARDFRIVGVKRIKRWGRWNVVTEHGTFYAEPLLRKG